MRQFMLNKKKILFCDVFQRIEINIHIYTAQWAGPEEYTDSVSAER